MKSNLLRPVAPDAPHPFLRDTDGGALMVDGDRQPTAQRKDWTPEVIESAAETDRRCRAWQVSAPGVAWLKSRPSFTMGWAVSRFGPELAERFL